VVLGGGKTLSRTANQQQVKWTVKLDCGMRVRNSAYATPSHTQTEQNMTTTNNTFLMSNNVEQFQIPNDEY